MQIGSLLFIGLLGFICSNQKRTKLTERSLVGFQFQPNYNQIEITRSQASKMGLVWLAELVN